MVAIRNGAESKAAKSEEGPEMGSVKCGWIDVENGKLQFSQDWETRQANEHGSRQRKSLFKRRINNPGLC